MTFKDRVSDLKDQTDAYLEGFTAGATAAAEAASREFGGFTSRVEEASRTHAVPALLTATAERDRARETAVRLEQELAESERKRIEDGTKLAAYEMEADNLIKGVLMEVRRAGSQKPAPEWAAVCDVVARAAQKFGVEL